MLEQALGGTPEEYSEDCLNLNVWTPGLDGSCRPVMVWVHGGSFMTGSGSGGLYRGGLLAREADVVVITINYRLGLLGYLAHPALADPGGMWLDDQVWTGTGNWGLADQVAALAWVRDHAASFGGDPGNVTLFGESAGGMSVSSLLAVPEAAGLFLTPARPKWRATGPNGSPPVSGSRAPTRPCPEFPSSGWWRWSMRSPTWPGEWTPAC
jgi:para-nitrobenzyl esterase